MRRGSAPGANARALARMEQERAEANLNDLAERIFIALIGSPTLIGDQEEEAARRCYELAEAFLRVKENRNLRIDVVDRLEDREHVDRPDLADLDLEYTVTKPVGNG